MSFRDRMNKKKKSLQRRHNAPPKPTGGRYPTVFIKNKIPDGIPFFSCSEGQHIIDILPWECGPDMPFNDQNEPVADEGDFDYVLDLFVHQNVGKMKQPFVCPYENFNEPCPICEYIKANRLPKDDWNKIRPKRRSIYLIWDRTNAEAEKKGVQIYDVAHFFMEEKLVEIAKLPHDGGYEVFSDPDEGKSICWTRKGSGMENTQYLGHRFIDRESPIPDKILEKTFSLDQVINMHPTYEEIAEAFGVTPAEEDVPFTQQEEDIDDSGFEEKPKPKPKQGAATPKPKMKRKKLVIKK